MSSPCLLPLVLLIRTVKFFIDYTTFCGPVLPYYLLLISRYLTGNKLEITYKNNKKIIPMSIKNKHCVSVVIPTVKHEDELEEIKASLLNQTFPASEVIIVNDDKRQGAAWARNQGIAQCTGDLIAFLDDDCLPPKNWLESLVDAIDKYQADGVGGTYEETDSLLIDRRKRQNYPNVEMEDTLGLVGAGGNLMFTRSWLDECIDVDGHVYNETFHIAEDWELIIRSRKRNVKLIYIPIRVKHFKKMTAFSYLIQQFGRGEGISKLYRLQKTLSNTFISQKSLLWGQGKKKDGAKWFKILWKKGFGPFDISSFSNKSNFILFWFGEKMQGIGFLWHLVNTNENNED